MHEAIHQDKPTKWGFKLWILACSTTGYTSKIQVYTEKKNNTETTNGLRHDVVMTLMDGLLKQGYHVCCDNFYSSPKLSTDLHGPGCFATDTVKENRQGFPKDLGNK